MKLVSVIITVFGDGQYLLRAISSIMNQDYKNIEIIVVDDNGLNSENQIKTKKIIHEASSKIKYIAHSTNMNGSAARNTGFLNSKGDFITFLDDDDEFSNDKVSKQVEILEKHDDDWGACYSSKITYLNGNRVSRKRAIKSGDVLYNHLMHTVRLDSGSLLIRRGAFETISGYDSTYWRHQDWEMGARLASKYSIAATDETYFIRNITQRNNPKNPDAAEQYMLKFINDINNLAPNLSGNQRKNIVAKNAMSIALKYVRKRNFKKFVALYNTYSNGLRGIKYLSYHVIRYFLPFDKSWNIYALKLQLHFVAKESVTLTKWYIILMSWTIMKLIKKTILFLK